MRFWKAVDQMMEEEPLAMLAPLVLVGLAIWAVIFAVSWVFS